MSLLKKVLRWSGGVLLLLVLAGAIGARVIARKHTQEFQLRERDRRSQRKLHIGDVPQTVRLRAGVPDTVERDARGGEGWFYEPKGVIWNAIVVFDRLKKVDGIFVVGDHFWIPEDGLVPTWYHPVDATLQAFREALGAPCDTTTSDDSAWVRFSYPLSQKELNEDSVYRRWNDSSGGSVIVRTLQIDLRRGRFVVHHGWSKASPGHCGRLTPP